MTSAASTPVPQTAYAQSDGVSIAYQVFGSGAHDLVVVPGIISHVEENWRLIAMRACCCNSR